MKEQGAKSMTKSEIIDMMTVDQIQILADVLEKCITDGAEAVRARTDT